MSDLTQPITAILLAAGSARRFKSNKLMHQIISRPSGLKVKALPMALMSALNAKPHIDRLICVVRPEDQALQAELKRHKLETVLNPNHQQGLSSSITAAIKYINPEHNIMICLADMPYIKASSYKAIIHQFQSNPKSIARPMLELNGVSKPGHPVIIPNHLRSDLLKLSGDTGASHLLKTNPPNILLLEDMGIYQDIDTPEDLNFSKYSANPL